MKIKLNLSSAGIKEAIKALGKYQDDLPKRADKCAKTLARIGENNARRLYEGERGNYDGTYDVEVRNEGEDGQYTISAVGESAAFVEFGTGVYFNSPDPYPIPRPANVLGIGEYGEHRGKNDFWFYVGEGGTDSEKKPGLKITHGNPAGACMYHAGQETRQYIETAAKDAFEQ